MSYEVQATQLFKKQVSQLSKKARRIIASKIELIKLNPFRFKRIRSKKFRYVFRIRLNLEGKEMRLIYALLGKIILVCLLERKHDY